MKKFIGIDLHSDKFTCCFMSEDEKVEMIKTFPVSDEGIGALKKYISSNTYVTLEASTNSFVFAQRVIDLGATVVLANTFKLKLISFTKKKTDKVDAQKLARFLKMQVMSKEDLIEPVWMPDVKTQEIRSLFTSYLQMRKQIVSTKNRIHSLLKQNLYIVEKRKIFSKSFESQLLNDEKLSPALLIQLKIQYKSLRGLVECIKEIKKEILLASLDHFRKEIEILTSISGVSPFIASALMSDIGDIKRFKNAKKLTSYLRSAPGIDASNSTVRNLGTNKWGRKLSITLLTQALNHVIENNTKISKWYKKLTQYKKPGLVRMGVCRRTFAEIFQMLKKEEYHHYRNEKHHEVKLLDIEKFLEGKSQKLLKLA